MKIAALFLLASLSAGCIPDEPGPLGEAVQEVLTSVDELQFVTQIDVGVLSDTYIVGWSPTDGTHTLANTSVIVTGAHDYQGTTIASIDNTGINIGDVRIICNFDAWLDDAVISLSNEDLRESTAGKRILVPGGAKGTLDPHRERFYIAPGACQPLMYVDTDFDTSTPRWVVVGSQPRIHRAVVQSLQLFPAMTVTLTSGNTYDNWDPVDSCPQVSGGAVGQGSATYEGSTFNFATCEAGGSTEQKDYSAIRIATSGSGTVTLNGLKGFYTTSDYNGNPWGLGPVKVLSNHGPGRIVLKSYATVYNDTGNEFYLPGGPNGGDIVIQDGGSVILWHGAQDSYWFVIGGNPGSPAWPRVVPAVLNTSTHETLTESDGVGNGDFVAIQGTGNLKCMWDASTGGTRKTLCNYNGNVTLKSNQSCTAPMQKFRTVSDADLTIPLWGCVKVYFDYTQPAWLVESKNF